MISIHNTLVLEWDIYFDIHCITCIVMYSMVSETIVKYQYS